jgi:diguanylate cyclase (GGDEF)-like protein
MPLDLFRMSAETEIARLTRRLKRETAARLEAEALAERGLRDLYQRQQEIALLEAIAASANAATDIDDALWLALERICAYTGWPLGHAYHVPAAASVDMLIASGLWHGGDVEAFAEFRQKTASYRFARGVGLPGRVLASGQPAWIDDVTSDDNFPRAAEARRAGLHAAFAFPVLIDTEVVGILEFFASDRLAPDDALLRIMAQIGTQLGRVVERKRAKERLLHDAHHDSLTGLANRLKLLGRLEQILASARREANRCAVMFLDLDRFKAINDSLGHAMGDRLLIEVANRLTATVRGSDIVARLGGDEFVVVLPGVPGAEVAARQAEKILAAVGAPCTIDGNELSSTPSIGIAMFPDDGGSVEELMKHADAAMYSAKNGGRNNYQFFTASMNEAAIERLVLEQSMRQGLARHEFLLHYQPQIDIVQGRLIGFEALVRWNHPREGMISPARFIPVAEDTGLITELGQYVVREALRQLRVWLDHFGVDIRMAINLSARQLRDKDLPALMAEALDAAGVAPRHVELEITESVAMANPGQTILILNQMRGMGMHLAVDDFGTGYSSLAYLKHLPIQRLKIDQSFVRDLETDPNDAAICTATIALAHSMGLEVIAEGVETPGQLAYLKRLGVDIAQGYLFSRPLAPTDAEAFLATSLPVFSPG